MLGVGDAPGAFDGLWCGPTMQNPKQLMCSAEGAGSVVLRTEALSALCGLAKNYDAVLTLHWASISHAVARNLQAKNRQSIEKSGSEPMAPRESCAFS